MCLSFHNKVFVLVSYRMNMSVKFDSLNVSENTCLLVRGFYAEARLDTLL